MDIFMAAVARTRAAAKKLVFFARVVYNAVLACMPWWWNW